MRLIIFFMATVFIALASASAATYYVPDDWPTIQGAITACANGDTVIVRPGTWMENIDFLGKAITVKSELGPEITIIDGNQAGSVVTFSANETSNSKLEGFTLTNGSGTLNPSGNIVGGGIYCWDTCPKIIKNTVSTNTAVYGGGIYCNNNSMPPYPTITQNTFSGNSASYGGGTYCNGTSPMISGNVIEGNTVSKNGAGMFFINNSSASVSNNTVKGNSADQYGGGILFGKDCLLSVTDNTVMDNAAGQAAGGGIVIRNNCSGIISGNIITGNSAFWAGGLFCQNNSDLTISENIFIENHSSTYGGGIYCITDSPSILKNNISLNTAGSGSAGIHVTGSSDPLIAGNIISMNTAFNNDGGGIGVVLDSKGMISNNVIAQNSAQAGGGVRCYMNASPTFSNNTIYGNVARNNSGGGIKCDENSSPEILNTIFWGNKAASGGVGPQIWVGGFSVLTIGHSDVEGGQAQAFVASNATLTWGVGMIDDDPLFAAGPKGFYYLSQKAAGQAADSPCVDTGSGPSSSFGMDMYWTRTDCVPDSGTVDMGFHYGPFTFPAFQTDTFMISAATGGNADFLLLAGISNANRNYILLGSITGTDPGTPLPGGMTALPLNWDIFTNMVLDLLNTPVFSNFMGQLDSTGSAMAAFDTLAPIPGAAGLTMSFAYALNNPWDFVSNPVGIEIVP